MHLLGTAQAMRLNRRRDRFGHVTAGRFGSTALHAHDEVARVAIYIATTLSAPASSTIRPRSGGRRTARRSAPSRHRAWLETAGCRGCSATERRRESTHTRAAVSERLRQPVAARPAS